ncbi:MAG: hypothetical protein IPK69_11925 [Phycisphaerales bacterium]|nr:MAG: hypothetical protein IPK69_11925 [Phycisphaerales bacterium]
MANVFTEENAIRLAVAGAASGTTPVSGATIDTAGYDGVAVFCTIATQNAGNYLALDHGDASDMSDGANVAGSKVVAVANGQVVCVDINKPMKRYVKPAIVRTAATITGDMYYILYKGQFKPTLNQVANTLISKSLVSPPTGTP